MHACDMSLVTLYCAALPKTPSSKQSSIFWLIHNQRKAILSEYIQIKQEQIMYYKAYVIRVWG